VGAHPFHLGIYGQEKKKLAIWLGFLLLLYNMSHVTTTHLKHQRGGVGPALSSQRKKNEKYIFLKSFIIFFCSPNIIILFWTKFLFSIFSYIFFLLNINRISIERHLCKGDSDDWMEDQITKFLIEIKGGKYPVHIPPAVIIFLK
jgi:hypothetical protein